MPKITILLLIQIIFASLSISQTTEKLNIQINPTIINKDGFKEKQILKQWENYLNSGDDPYYGYYAPKSLAYWFLTEDFPIPVHFLAEIGSNVNDIKNVKQLKISVIALYPVGKDTFGLKTAFYYNNDSLKIFVLEFITTVYAVYEKDSVKFFSSPEWYNLHWRKKEVGSIKYYFPKEHDFDLNKALKLDSFNNRIARLFKTEPIKFKYFLCQNNANIDDVFGLDFSLSKYVPNHIGGASSPSNLCVFGGNGTEYYPHEVVHLYTAQYWGKDGNYYHAWFGEGMAALFGGSRDQTLEWHLRKLKTYLETNPKETFSDLFNLTTVPNGEFTTEYNYAIGGLICKTIYEKEGMDGLIDLLKSGYPDEDFYKAVEKHLGVKKNNFSTFVRDELKKY